MEEKGVGMVDGFAVFVVQWEKPRVKFLLTDKPIPEAEYQALEKNAIDYGDSAIDKAREQCTARQAAYVEVEIQFEPKDEPHTKEKARHYHASSSWQKPPSAPQNNSFGSSADFTPVLQGHSEFVVNKENQKFRLQSKFWIWELDLEIPLWIRKKK